MTPDAREIVATLISQRLTGGTMVVRGGDTEASAPLSVTVDGTTVVASAIFDEQAANFQWTGRAVLDGNGTVWDALAEDLGVKRAGAVWTIDVPIEIPDA